MIKVKPQVNKWFEIVGINIDGKALKPQFTIDYVWQNKSWLLVMITLYNNEKYCTPEYSDKPIIDHSMICQMCYSLETTLNCPEDNQQAWYMSRDQNKPNLIAHE